MVLSLVRTRIVAALGATLAAVVALLVGADASMAAATYDLAPVASGITDQVQAALTVILPIAGGILALFVGWRVLKRIVRA